jgi:hypothetical protein
MASAWCEHRLFRGLSYRLLTLLLLRKDPAVPFENQNLDVHNLTGTAATWDDQSQAQQVPVCTHVLRVIV